MEQNPMTKLNNKLAILFLTSAAAVYNDDKLRVIADKLLETNNDE